MKKKITFILVWLLFVAGCYYLMIPAINIHNLAFWSFVLMVMIVPAIFLTIIYKAAGLTRLDLKRVFSNGRQKKISFLSGLVMAGAAVIGIMFFGGFFGAKIFHASAYASILQIEERDFSEDIDESKVLDKVALMDTDSARILGDRKIGSLSNVVSQFNVSYDYSQIDYQGYPLKVSALEYAGFFKYMGNKEEGIPGYVTVDPVAQTTEYVEVEDGMKYVPSSYFGKDLARHLRFQYPTYIFSNLHFEINEEGKPYYVASVLDYTISLFGGETVKGVVICDPCTGETQYCAVEEIPTWVDIAFDGDLLVQQFDWYGRLSNGFFNSLFAKKGCMKSTETVHHDPDDEEDEEAYYSADYGYIAKDGDIWIYTGVTSVNEDSSNIGFIMVNERTGEARYFSVAGADESSAMAAAEGEVQEKRYVASFPSLINVDGNATYIMVLKDANGIVKMYAMVNVEQYNLVATGDTIEECFSEYRKLLGVESDTGADDGTEEDTKEPEGEYTGEKVEMTFTVAVIRFVEIDGNTYVYLGDEEGRVFSQKFEDNTDLLFVEVGDVITCLCIETDTDKFAMVNE